METITKKIDVYNFNELSKEIQEKLIKKEREYQEEAYCESFLLEEMEEEAKRLLQKYFKGNATLNKVFYDLSYSQGSGAMIEFELYYYNKYVKIKQNGLYYHQRSFTIDSYELTEMQESKLYDKIAEMNSELTKAGYNLIEYFWENNSPDSEYIELLEEHKFLEDGTIYE